MGLFFDVLSAINNPNQMGSVEQLGTIMQSAQQLGDRHGLSASTLQTAMSTLGEVLLPVLKQQSLTPGGDEALTGLVNHFAQANAGAGAQANAGAGAQANVGAGAQATTGAEAAATTGTEAALPSFLTPQLQQQIVQAIAQRTGLSAEVLQPLLPELVATAMGFLGMGAPKPGATGNNSILNAILDSNQDGSTDLGDVFKFARRFLHYDTTT